MAKAKKCDICGSYYDIYFSSPLEAPVKYPNRIFYVNYLDVNDNDGTTFHCPEINPAKTALSMLNNEFAKYDVCPSCMGKIYSKRNVKEVK